MQTNQDSSIQELRKCTVAIQRRGKSGIRGGTGVIVSNDGLILTCYHVVGSIQSKSLDEIVDNRFPLIPEVTAYARPIKGDPILDIAFLQLEGSLPQQTTSAMLCERIILRNNYRSFGFRESDKIEGGLYSVGTIQGKLMKSLTTHYKTSFNLQ